MNIFPLSLKTKKRKNFLPIKDKKNNIILAVSYDYILSLLLLSLCDKLETKKKFQQEKKSKIMLAKMKSHKKKSEREEKKMKIDIYR